MACKPKTSSLYVITQPSAIVLMVPLNPFLKHEYYPEKQTEESLDSYTRNTTV